MGTAYLYGNGGSGGGGGGMELTIIVDTVRPAKATHNAIWVESNVDATSYALTTVDPENPEDGALCISIGESGAVKMASPVGENWITVYPLSAKQFINGDWVSKVAKSYQNGEWVDWWNGELYKDGDAYTDYTGGWTTGELYGNSTVTINADSIQLSTSSGSRAHVETKEKVKFGEYKNLTIVFDVINSASTTNVVRLGYSTNKTTNLANATTKVEDVLGKGTTGERSLSISLDGAPESAYVVVGVGVTGTIINLKKVQMTK